MSDISTIWKNGVQGDWALQGSQLQSGNDLQTAVLISLFTDRVVPSNDQINDGTGDPRGWWADDPSAPIGSRLWLLRRSKQTNETLSACKDYITEALRWLIDDDVAVSIDVECEWAAAGMLASRVTVFRKDGTNEAMRFAWAWNGTN